MPLTPNNREEHWLQGMVDGQTTLVPNKRREYWYQEIVDAIGSGGGGGTGGGVLIVNQNGSGTLDKTWQEIYDANFAVVVAEHNGKTIMPVLMVAENSGTYGVMVISATPDGVAPAIYTTNNANGYPVAQ